VDYILVWKELGTAATHVLKTADVLISITMHLCE